MRTHNYMNTLSQALAEPSRRAILENLRLGPKSVTELVQATQLKQPNVSNHLAKMREQGIVRAERHGRQVYYSIALPVTDTLLRLHECAVVPVQIPPYGTEHAIVESPLAPAIAPGSPSEDTAQTDSPDNLAEWRNAYFQSVIAGQEEHAISLVNAMLVRRLDMSSIYIDVFQWALYRTGELYQQGVLDEAQEHLVSAMTGRMMAKVAQFYTPVARPAYRALLGCVAGNQHALGLRMLSDGLKGLGWEALFLGANVPTSSFLSMTTAMNPDLVVISCTLLDQIPETRELVSRLQALRQQMPQLPFQIAVGGPALNAHPEILQEMQPDITAFDLPEFLDAVRRRFPGES